MLEWRGRLARRGWLIRCAVVWLLVTACGSSLRADAFRRADSNADGRVDVSDGLRSLEYLFVGAAEIPCIDAADADDSGSLDITDVLYTFSFLFEGGPNPPAPHGVCGDDPTGDGLDCAAYEPAIESRRCGALITAAFAASPASGPAPLTVRLNALASSSPTGPILEFGWVLGDGSTALGPVLTHEYTEPGEYTIELSVIDVENATATATRVISVEGFRPTTIVRTGPSSGENGVALTRETVVEFRRPVTSEVWPDAVRASFGGEIIPARYQRSPDGRKLTLFYRTMEGDPWLLPASARVRVTIDGDLISDDLGRAVDADGDGEEGGVRAVDFDTIALASIPGTTVTGTVMASERSETPDGATEDLPLSGVTIRIDGAEDRFSVMTDENGRFVIEDAPAGTFFVHVDGRTATVGVPSGAYYPIVGKPWHSIAGQSVDVGTVYLPLIAKDTLRPVSEEVPTEITFPAGVLARFPDLAGVSVTVPPGSLFSDDGTRGGAVGIAPVPPDRLPGVLPPELRFPLVITVQTDAAGNFDVPAPVTFPNLPDPVTGEILPPGAKTAVWSFDHDRGAWGLAGPATVTPDGAMVVSDPGTGIRAPGWGGISDRCSGESRPPDSESEGESDSDDPPGTVEPVCPDALENLMKDMKAISDCAKVAGVSGPVVDMINQVLSTKKKLEDALSLATVGSAELVEIEVAFKTVEKMKEKLKTVVDALDAAANPISKLTDGLACLSSLLDAMKSRCGEGVPEACFPSGKEGATEAAGCDPAELEDLKKSVDEIQKMIEKLPTGLHKAALTAICIGLDELKKILEDHAKGDGGAGGVDPVLVGVLGDLLGSLESFDVYASIDTAIAASFLPRMADYLADVGDAYARVRGVAADSWVLIAYGELTQRLRADSRGGFDVILPPNTLVSSTLFDPRSGRIGTTLLLTGPAGTRSEIHHPVLAADSSEDVDGDGLGVDAEDVVGTDPEDADSDDDGISDGAEVKQGTDPLDGRPTLSGVIATADTPGRAVDVAVVNDIVVVADSDRGISILGAFNGVGPVVIAQVDTPGTALAVDYSGELDVVAVADGNKGLALVDVSDPPGAELTHQLTVGGGSARAVAVSGKLAFVGTTSGWVTMVDMATGTALDTENVARRIEDLVVDRDLLFIYADRRLHVIEIVDGALEVIGSVESPGFPRTRGRLAVGGGIAYMVHATGYNTVDVSVPESPALIAVGSTAQIAWHDLSLNGSGEAVVVGGVNPPFDASHNVWVYDANDPSVTGDFVVELQTPGSALAVSIYNGLAYVADYRAGLQVVNYLEYDAGDVAPEVSFETNPVGPEAEEGSRVIVEVAARDDVQVRNVELVFDGEMVQTDGSFPFQFTFNVPLLAESEAPEFTLRVVASDTGGNRTSSPEAVFTILPDRTPPRVTAVTPPPGSIGTHDSGLLIAWSERIATSELSDEHVHLAHAGADGVLDTADDDIFEGASFVYHAAIRALQVRYEEPFVPGAYRAVATMRFSDPAGNSLLEAFDWTFDVIDIPDLSKQDSFEIGGAVNAEPLVHSFLAPAGQRVFFDEQTECDTANVLWSCVDEDGNRVFGEQSLEDCSISGEVGQATLARGGRYEVRVSGVGSYRFAVWNVVTSEYEIEIGDTISEGVPGPGAGRIEIPGESDIYTFTAAAGEEVYFQDLAPGCGELDIVWDLFDEDGTGFFRSEEVLAACGPSVLGSVRLERGGNYTLVVSVRAGGRGRGGDDGLGPYGFKIWPITPGRFDIAVGDTVSENVPGPGAGVIETPGNHDEYAFSVSPGTTVYFDELGPRCGASPVWGLLDEDGVAVFENDDLEDCGPENTVTLERGGTYTIRVRAALDLPMTGPYSFRLVEQ